MVPGGWAADTETTKAPPNLPRNKIMLIFDGFLIPALVGTGPSILVVSLSVCRRL